MSIALTVYAWTTKTDFTIFRGILSILIMCMALGSLLVWLFHIPMLRMGLNIVGVMLFGLYLIVDTQHIMGGNHKYSLDPEEYILGSIMLYLDIINIFIYILEIF